MKTQTNFRDYNPEQVMRMPPDLAKRLPEDHLAYFIREGIGPLDLSTIYADSDGSKGGYPAYHPEMMVALLLYAYSVGRNFTDPDSRIMKGSATKSFARAYNCQAAVDSQSQGSHLLRLRRVGLRPECRRKRICLE